MKKSVLFLFVVTFFLSAKIFALDEKSKLSADNSAAVASPPSTPIAPAISDAAPVAESAQKPVEQPRRTVKDYLNFRDPFLRIPIDSLASSDKPFLERYPLASFKLKGVLSGPLKKRAMLETPDGKVHFVAESNRIGMREGKVDRITTRSVIIREKIVNPVGVLEEMETEIVLDESK